MKKPLLVSEVFGAKVGWDEKERMVIIDKQ
ncbi:copper amine oxidase N-terminal domain-containing protein [Paenibacillus alginolyticus]|uniref:Copper amine oxidase N-terminal domain-containing protein n=1 Tax=Paenibacillus alginolyticus TaxID=59839 RepID=A0ABT4GA21_9BACL|nr:copper amine oxidase N-terminal domain-containing protein [Paenibacillus alginolyticus]MCY9693026.1 copper amine oxidase N-terminal domain-containing protein [Paenibacillus alginolyticus]